jgi:two-component system OmpR family response regulator
MRILIVEDEPTLGQQLKSTLEQTGYAVDLSTDGEDGHFLGSTEQVRRRDPRPRLPEIDGLTVLGMWRKEGRNFPGAGADRARQLVGQGRRARRRRRRLPRQAVPDRGADRPPARADPPRLGQRQLRADRRPVRLDTRSGRVTLDGEPVKLTAQEYKLLSYLMHHKGKVVSRTELIEHIYDQDFDRDSNTIEVFVTRIRKKLGANVITTIRGLGYSLDDPDEPGRGE